jgi:hypothetical protein
MTYSVLQVVQKHFPKVTMVRDATRALEIEVTVQDGKEAKKRNHDECAMAKACKRAYKADGVILSRSVAYLIKGTLAIRFSVPEAVSREIVSFDRGGGFAPGIYKLVKPQKHHLGEGGNRGGGHNPKPNKPDNPPKFRHMTSGIRTVLGGKDAEV